MPGSAPSSEKLRCKEFEYLLAEHCNLSCYNCDHSSPLMPQRFASLEAFEREIGSLGTVLHAERLKLMGGEPLLHPQILDFISVAREVAVADRIFILTNGVLLHKMPEAFWQSIDSLQVSRYPGVRIRMKEDELRALCERHDVELDICPLMEDFQMRLLNDPLDDPKLVRTIFRECLIAHDWGCFSLSQGMFFRCSVAPFVGKRLALAGKEGPPLEADGVPVIDNPNPREELHECMTTRRPLDACNYCLGTSGPEMPHRQMNRRESAAWLAEDHAGQVAFARRRVRLQHLGRITSSAVGKVMRRAPEPLREALVRARNRVFQYKV